MQQTQDNEEIDLKDLFFHLLGHWKIVLLAALAAGVLMMVYSVYFVTPKYQSTSELYVLSKSTSITSLADIQMGSNLTNDYMVVVKGRPVLEQVIAKLELNETYQSLGGKITLNNPSDSRILQIIVEDTNPDRAKLIADEMAKVSSAFISEKMDQDPPTIIQNGYADGAPVSPNIFKNILLGILAGAFVAMAIVTVLYLMNDTIMSADDVEKKLGLHLLGTLPLENEETDEGELKGKAGKNKKKTDKKSA